jgi:ABC-type transporter Mla subunit MlaD
MNEHSAPTSNELKAFTVLINFLHQVRSHQQDINEEAERLNRLLEQQSEVFDRHRSGIEDLVSALSDYEDEMERVRSTVPPDPQDNQ